MVNALGATLRKIQGAGSPDRSMCERQVEMLMAMCDTSNGAISKSEFLKAQVGLADTLIANFL